MRTITFLAVMAYVAQAAANETPSSADPVELCGSLGVMEVPEHLPEGVTADDVRMCAEHPLAGNLTIDPSEEGSLAPYDEDEEAPALYSSGGRACYKKAPYGCSRGFCWKACGNKEKGEWCWTAASGGVGAWRQCSRWQQCGEGSFSFGCGRGCLFHCGCSC